MSLVVNIIKERQIWDDFVTGFSPNNFLQSWQFGQFSRAMGDEPFYLGVYEDGELIGVGLFIKTQARRGDYYACAAGPLIKSETRSTKSQTNSNDQNEKFKTVLKVFVQYLREQEDAVFVRIRPALLNSSENQKLFAELGFRPAPMHLHAERTWVLDITLDEDEIMKGMRKNTRYYVRRASKDGVTVRVSKDIKDAKILHDLQQETVQRHGFVPFSLHYFEGLMKAFADNALFFIASYKDEDISCAMINYYGDQAVYHYAASSSRYEKVPASYLILWEAILEAKKRGCKYFNFWGVVGDDETRHPWHGLSRFKKGFGGEEVRFLHAQDYPLSSRYWLTWGVEKIRKWKRGL